MSNLPSPIQKGRRIYFMCLGCWGPGNCSKTCPCKQWPKTPEANVDVCLELHRHRTFGPELWGVPRRSNPDLPFSPKAIKERLEKSNKVSQSVLAKQKAKRNVKRGTQTSMLSFLVDPLDENDHCNDNETDNNDDNYDKKPAATL